MTLNPYILLVGVCCSLFSAVLGLYCMNLAEKGSGIAQSPTAERELPTEEPTELVITEFASEKGLLGRAKTLLQLNADTVGWITIEGTQVDYPIVQTTDNEYYLSVGFDHQEYRAGSIFMDYRDVFGFSIEDQSENIVLYGHNMANNTMFGSLRPYRQDDSYYKTHQYIELYSNYDHFTFVIFGLVITSGDATADWKYWQMEELDTEEEYNAYIETVRNKSLVDIDVDVQYGDQLLTLSTCYDDTDNSRFLVVARKMREDETAETLQTLTANEAS